MPSVPVSIKLLSNGAQTGFKGKLSRQWVWTNLRGFLITTTDTGLLAHILPSLDRCYGLDGGLHHAETVFEHNLLVGDALPASRPILRLAGFLHDTGKMDALEIKEGGILSRDIEVHPGDDGRP